MTIAHIKNLFVPLMPDREGKPPAIVSYGMSLAERAKAHLTFRVLGLHYASHYSVAPHFVGSITGSANAEQTKRMEQAEVALSAQLASSGLAYDLSRAQLDHEGIVELCAFMGRLHDLTLIGRPEGAFVLGRALVEELLFQTGRPVIIVPAVADVFRAKRIVVAWDGTARASRALNDAMPLLRQAEYVEITSIQREKDLTRLVPGAEVAPQLARHGVNVTVANVDATGADAGRSLRERAELVAADMIVMGAFAHSRWRQLVLGGVTDSMLQHSELPVFMSH